MRFDLEIHPTLTKLVYVDQGKEIPQSYLPALYVNTNDINIQPSDMISLELSSQIDALMNIPITQVNFTNSLFQTNTDKILITHIVRYSKITGTKYPIFYKHVINIPNGAQFIDQSIQIYNESGAQLDKDLYLIETGSNYVYVYITPIDNSILSIAWADTISSHKELLKLQPIFADKGADFNTNSLGMYDFCCIPNATNGNVDVHMGMTSGSVYITSTNSFAGVLKPVGNINDSWFLQTENIMIYSQGVSGVKCTYVLPEYYTQKMQDAISASSNGIVYDSLYKQYTNQICRIIDGIYLQLQFQPSIYKLGNIDIKIYNKLTNIIAYGFTSDTSKIGQEIDSSGIIWTHIDDYSYDGIIQIGTSIDNTYYNAYADYYIDNKYYEFRMLDLNAIENSYSSIIALYIAPTYDANDIDQNKLFFVYIGQTDARTNTQKFKQIGAGFTSKTDYQTFISQNNCMHLCYTSIDSGTMYDMLDITYCATSQEQQPYISDSDLSTYSVDLLANGLINSSIRFQLNDTAVCTFDTSIFSNNSDKDQADIENNEYLNFAKQIISENSTISTRMLIDKSIVNSVQTIGA